MPRKTNRNAQGSGTIRQRADGIWEARFTVGRNPGTGKQIQRSLYASTQREVQIKLRQALSAVDAGAYVDPSKMTVAQWLESWLKEYTADVKPYTQRAYATNIKNQIIPALGALRLDKLTPLQVQKFYNNCMRGEKNLKPKTVKNIHGVLHSALKQAVMNGMIRSNPSESCTIPRIERMEIKPFDDEAEKSFLRAIEGDKYERLFVVDLYTGMRKGEILGLRWSDIDFEQGTITISRQLQVEPFKGGRYYLAPLKNDKERVITPAPYVMQILREQRRCQNEARLLAGGAWDEGDIPGLVFTNELGKHLCHQTIGTRYKKLVKAAGLPDARFHDLRHSYAVAAIRSGDDIKTVQSNLGHHSAAFTLDTYAHATAQMKRESADRMQAHIQAIKSCKG